MLKANQVLLCLAASALVSACGGGETPESATPQGAAQALKAALKTESPMSAQTRVVPLEEAAEHVFAYAEGKLPAYFPNHPETMSQGPFKYRYYPETDTYLGLVVSENTAFTYGGVYVAGLGLGTLAKPYFAGSYAAYITPFGEGKASACYDVALLSIQGTQIDVAYKNAGSITTVVGGLTTFGGHAAQVTEITSALTGGADDFTLKTYSARWEDAVLDFGSELQYRGGVVAGAYEKAIYSPAFMRGVYSLAAGASVTESPSGSVTSTSGTGQTTTLPLKDSTTTKFVGLESVTVPAGTYSACKLEVTSSASNAVTTQWLIAGKGIMIKKISAGQTLEATSVKLNGAAL